MSLRKLPEIAAPQRPKNYQFDPPSDALAKWSERPLAAEADDATTISVYDVIGYDPWSGGGWTAKRMAGALRAIGAKDVTVKINSPGGDMFEGIAIYNLLREHPANVTVDVMGLAASAASVVAMAADEIRMGLGTFMMVHNAWGIVIGNRHDFRDAADLFDGFDGALTDIYQARTGLDRNVVAKLMDAETWMGPSQAVDQGFADSINEGVSADNASAKVDDSGVFVKRRVDAILAQHGVPRVERRRMLRELAGTQDAAGTATQYAGFDLAKIAGLISTINR